MLARFAVTVFCLELFAFGAISFAQEGEDDCPALGKSQLLVQLPEICPTPDGMALDAEGNVILTCPNYGDKTHPAVLMKIDAENNVRLFAQLPIHPQTGTACPMGITFGTDGHLYVVDNQGWAKANGLGRVLRLKMKDGRWVGTEVVAYAMAHPNGIRVYQGNIYVTQSMGFPGEEGKPLVSGVYRFPLDAVAVKVDNTLEDENLLVTFTTENMDVQYGADGLVFDSQGNLYVGNFGDATLHKIAFDPNGKVTSNERWVKDKCIKSIDGICADADDNIYVADFSANAVCRVTPEGKVQVLAKSPDCDGSQGGLDQPGEPLVRGDELIVSCFDMVTGPDKLNTGHDAPHTIAVIKLTEE